MLERHRPPRARRPRLRPGRRELARPPPAVDRRRRGRRTSRWDRRRPTRSWSATARSTTTRTCRDGSRAARSSPTSDNEVALHLLDEFGPEALRRLNGMFAFVMATEDGRFVAARDPVGIKPLYWAPPGDGRRAVRLGDARVRRPTGSRRGAVPARLRLDARGRPRPLRVRGAGASRAAAGGHRPARRARARRSCAPSSAR